MGSNIKGIIFDNMAEARLRASKVSYVVAMEEYAFSANGGEFRSFPKKVLSQQEATIQADRILRDMNTTGDFIKEKGPWLDLLAPQLVLYFISKLLRVDYILRQLPGGVRSWQVCSANGMVSPMMKSILPGAVVAKTPLFSKRVLKDFLISHSPRLMGWQRQMTILEKRGFVADKVGPIKGSSIFWCPNTASEQDAIQIAEVLSAKGVSVLYVTSRSLQNPLTISQLVFQDSIWKRQIKENVLGLRRFLDHFAKAIIRELFSNDNNSAYKGMVRVLRGKLELFFVPQATNALAYAQRALDIVGARSVFIQDLGDCRTRAVAWVARKRKIPVFHLQQGTVTPAAIEWKWDIANKHLIWGEWSQEILRGLEIPPDKTKITGTPKISCSAPQMQSSIRMSDRIARALFTLMPASPLSFGNGGSSSLMECHVIMKMLLQWIKLMEGRVVLQIKPRPLRDHEWFASYQLNLPSYVEILSNDITVKEALENTDLVITTHSTVATDAIFMGKPLVVLSGGYEPHPYAEAVQFDAAKMAGSVEDLKNISEELFFNENERNKMIKCQLKYRSRILKYTGEESAERIVSCLQ